jgi:Nuclease-related domain
MDLNGSSGRRPRGLLDEEAVKRTGQLLERLPESDWTVLSGIDPRHGVEHVAIGVGGVFVFSSRKPEGAGAARVKDGVVWLRKGADARADKPGVSINRQALEAGKRLHREIRSRTGRGPWVHPVVVLWCEFPQRVAESRQIAFVHGRDLLTWLTARPQELDEPGRAEVLQAVRAISNARAPRHRWRAPHIGARRNAA